MPRTGCSHSAKRIRVPFFEAVLSWITPLPVPRLNDFSRDGRWFAAHRAVEDLAAQVRTARPVLPPVLSDPPSRLTFLRTAEVLLRMELDPERRPVSLAVPAFRDGTLDLAHLLRRLDRVGPWVGPLDLVQALHRLRPSDPSR